MIRRAQVKDVEKIMDLLCQVDLVHHNLRPDIFKIGNKYSEQELLTMLKDDKRPILVYVNGVDEVLGYCFCVFQQHVDNAILTDIKTLYIDDLCVDEKERGKNIGKQLYDAALNLAKQSGCYNLTLNVWASNKSALKFYEKCGLVPLKIGMEKIL